MTVILEIDGIPDAFYSGPTAPALSGKTLHPCVLRTGQITSTLDVKGARVQASEATITLGMDGIDTAPEQLLRLSPYGAERFLTLALTLPQSDAIGGVVTTNETNTAWPTSGHLWIGQECIAYSSKPSSTTFTISERGAYNSEVQQHVADPALSRAPRIYSECCVWKGRRARIMVQARGNGGHLYGPMLCEVDGVIEGVPEANGDGLEVDVLVRSWAARTERVFGGDDAVTGLQGGWHIFDGRCGHDLSHISQGWLAATAFETTVRTAFLAGATAIDVNSTDGYDARFDPTKSSDQRGGRLVFLSPSAPGNVPDAVGASIAFRVAASGAGPTLTIDPPADYAGSVGDVVRNAECRYSLQPATVLTTPGVPEALSWPGEALRRLQSFLGSRDITDADGLWANMTLRQTAIAVRRNDGPVGQPTPANASFFVQIAAAQAMGVTSACAGLCFGTDLPALVADPGGHILKWRRPGWPTSPDRAGVGRFFFRRPRNGGDVTPDPVIPMFMPQAYWAVGERYLLTANNPVGVPTMDGPASVITETTWEGERVRQIFRIVSAVQASTITAGALGWALEIHPDDYRDGYPVVDRPGQEPSTVRAVVAVQDVSPTIFMLQLLLSGSGNGYNHADYDVLSAGCNLPSSAVDVRSFEEYDRPGADLGSRTMVLAAEENTADLLRALAVSVGGVITERVCRESGPLEGRRRLALVPLRLPIRSNAVRTIARADIPSGLDPANEVDDTLVNQVVVKARGTNSALEETEIEVRVHDLDSITEHGASEAEVIDAVGVTFSPPGTPAGRRASLITLAQQRFFLFGHPRRVVFTDLTYGAVCTLSTGDVIWLDGGLARNPRGLVSQSGGLVRVTEVMRDAELGKGSIRGDYFEGFFKGAGWAPSMRVASVDSTTQVTVEANAFCATTHAVLGTPQTDAGFFVVGDTVRCFGLAPSEGAAYPGATRTITAISGNTITLNAAHGLGVGGGMTPADFTSVSADLQAYAYCSASPVQVFT